jgi:hypothetical protein
MNNHTTNQTAIILRYDSAVTARKLLDIVEALMNLAHLADQTRDPDSLASLIDTMTMIAEYQIDGLLSVNPRNKTVLDDNLKLVPFSEIIEDVQGNSRTYGWIFYRNEWAPINDAKNYIDPSTNEASDIYGLLTIWNNPPKDVRLTARFYVSSSTTKPLVPPADHISF